MATNTQQTTLIQFIGDYKGYLTVSPNTVFPITLAIADIKDVTKKTGVFSKSITVDGTKDNNKLLGNYYDVNIEAGTFNINTLQYCNVIQNGIPILENMLVQLVSINKVQTDSYYEDKITYTLLIKDSNGDFFTAINNKFLSSSLEASKRAEAHELDFTYLNHLYTASNVAASFNNTWVDGYKYVMPWNPTSGSRDMDNQFLVTEFSPAIYAKTYFDAIFANAGYSYQWDTMTGSTIHFDKLLIPYNGDVINTELDPTSYLVEAYNSGSTTSISLGGSGGGDFDANHSIQSDIVVAYSTPIETVDTDNLFTPSNGVFATPNIPSYTNDVDITIDFDYELSLNNQSGNVVYSRGFWFYSQIFFTNAEPVNSGNLYSDPKVYIFVNGVFHDSVNIYDSAFYFTQDQAFGTGFSLFKNGTKSFKYTLKGIGSSDTIQINTQHLFGRSEVQVGNRGTVAGNDTGWFMMNDGTGFGEEEDVVENAKIELKISNATIKYEVKASGDYGYNVPINMNLFVPREIKQSEFVKSIFTMFNLYCEPDKENPYKLILTPRDTYYDAGAIKDWTNKLAKDSNQDIKFLPELQSAKLRLTYKADTDIANKTYTDTTSEIYGQVTYNFNNEYAKDITTKEIIFSPTPMVNSPSLNAVLPFFAGPPKTNIRILYDGGQRPCTSYTISDYPNGPSNSSNQYPFLSHWDKPVNPTFDINFFQANYLFRTDEYGTPTNNNLFNLHWRRTLGQIENGKQLTAYFHLTALDIKTLKLNDKIRIDNSWWNINRVLDYDANSDKLTKVELNSIDDNLYIDFESEIPIKLDRSNPKIGIPINSLASDVLRYKNTILNDIPTTINGIGNVIASSVAGGTIMGNNNRVGSSGIVIGDGNQIPTNGTSFMFGSLNTGSTGSFVVGSGNLITPSGVTGGYIIMGNQITASTPNALYASNVIVPAGGSITLNNQSFSAFTQSPWTSGSSGSYSVRVINDSTTDAIGNYALAEGFNTLASGLYSHAEGTGTFATGTTSHAEGDGTEAFGDYSHAEGNQSTATGMYSHAEGLATLASGNASHAGGLSAMAHINSEWSRSNNGNVGQYGSVSLSVNTTGTTPTQLEVGGLGGVTIFTIPSNTAYRWYATASARNTATGDVKEWSGDGLIKNVGGTTSMVGSTFTSTFGDVSLVATTLVATADNATDELVFTATGIAATNINWIVRVDYVKVV